MLKEPSQIQEDYLPTGGAGFAAMNHVTVDDVLDVLAGRIKQDANGRQAGYWFAEILEHSNLVEIPVMVAVEMVQKAAAYSDGSMPATRGYIEEIIGELV